VDGNGSAATAMLGLAGFVLLAVSELGGEVEQAIETTEGWSAAQAAECGPGGDADLGEADLAVRRAGLCGGDLDRAQPGDPAAGVVDRAGPPGGVPAGRAGRSHRGSGRRAAGGRLGHGDGRGDRVRAAADRRAVPTGRGDHDRVP